MTISPPAIKAVVAEETGIPPGSITLEQTCTGRFNHTWFVSAPDLERDRVIRIARDQGPGGAERYRRTVRP